MSIGAVETDEKLSDEIYREIKNICFEYLQCPDNIHKYEKENLEVAFNFVTSKFNEVLKLKKDLKMKTYNTPFQEIGTHLDNVTIHDFYGKKEESIMISFTKDVNTLIEGLGFCYGILDKMIIDKLNHEMRETYEK